jgi:hypothetical protein
VDHVIETAHVAAEATARTPARRADG